MAQFWVVVLTGPVIALVIVLVSKLFAMPRLSNSDAIQDGFKTTAEVLEIRQAGVTLNQVPLMHMKLRIHGSCVIVRQYIDLGNMPRSGEAVRVLVDSNNIRRVTYIGLLRGHSE